MNIAEKKGNATESKKLDDVLKNKKNQGNYDPNRKKNPRPQNFDKKDFDSNRKDYKPRNNDGTYKPRFVNVNRREDFASTNQNNQKKFEKADDKNKEYKPQFKNTANFSQNEVYMINSERKKN